MRTGGLYIFLFSRSIFLIPPSHAISAYIRSLPVYISCCFTCLLWNWMNIIHRICLSQIYIGMFNLGLDKGEIWTQIWHLSSTTYNRWHDPLGEDLYRLIYIRNRTQYFSVRKVDFFVQCTAFILRYMSAQNHVHRVQHAIAAQQLQESLVGGLWLLGLASSREPASLIRWAAISNQESLLESEIYRFPFSESR